MPNWKIMATAVLVAGMIMSAQADRAFAAEPNEIIGIWESENKALKLEFFSDGPEYNARIVWGDKIYESDGVTLRQDSLNPDPGLRSRTLKGLLMVKGLVYQNGSWSGGTAYDAMSGRTYNCNAEVADDKLQMRGYIGVALLGRTMVFTKVPADTPRANAVSSKARPAKR